MSTPRGGRSKGEAGGGKETKGGVVKRMVHDLQDGPCVSLPRRGCKASANDTLVAGGPSPIAGHRLHPWPHPLEPLLEHARHTTSPSPLLLTTSSGADHPSMPSSASLRLPSHTLFCGISLLLPQISGIDCALDSSGPVRQTRHMSWRVATSISTVSEIKSDQAGLGWRPGNRRQGECDGKRPLVPSRGGRRPSLEDRASEGARPKGPNRHPTAQSNIRPRAVAQPEQSPTASDSPPVASVIIALRPEENAVVFAIDAVSPSRLPPPCEGRPSSTR